MRQVKVLVELGLAKQDNLHQLVVAGFKVGQQPDLLKGLQRHRMRFVDQGNDLFALCMNLDQPLLQGADQFGGITTLGIDAQIAGNHGEHLVARQRRHGEVNRFYRVGQAFHQHPAQHGLAGTHLTGNLDHALATGNGVNQRIEGFAAIRPREEELGMGSDFKRCLGQAEVFQIHRHVCQRLGVLSSISGSISAYFGRRRLQVRHDESSIAVNPPSSCRDATPLADCIASISTGPAHAPPVTYFPGINPAQRRCTAAPALSILCPG